MPTVSLKDEETKELLKLADPEFARIYNKHREIDDEVRLLEERHHLTPDEEIREKQLKKDKLHLKDQMTEMIRAYQEQQTA
jgi:uncharacterized protein